MLDAPFDIVGHSLGALTAFELARWLRRAGGPQPERLFVSGRGAPHLPSDGEDISRRDSAFFVRLLRDFGGTPSRVIEDPRMAEMIIPALRADLVMHQRYVYRYDEPLDTSITAFAALDDERAQPIDVEQWGVHTAATFRRIDHPGGHFAIIEDPSPLVAQLEGDAR